MSLVYYNDRFIETHDVGIDSTNRSFRYGDGLFETIFIAGGVPAFIQLHIERLMSGMLAMGISIPENWSPEFFKTTIQELCNKNSYTNARCRLTVWRSGAGFYLPQTDASELLIELSESSNADYQLNEKGLKLGVFENIPKLIHPISAFKTANALVYVMAAKFAKQNGYDDVLVLNNEGRVADAISSNLFYYKDRSLFTPAADEGGVDGVMKKNVITVCRREGIEVNEIKMTAQGLQTAEEIFLTNAINGLQWVEWFENKYYVKQFATDLIYILNEEKDHDTLVSP